jgi:hypothetical protein
MAKAKAKDDQKGGLTPERVAAFESYDDIRRELFSDEEITRQDAAVDSELAILRAMQESVSKAVAGFMAQENIGFNELTRRMETSTRQSARILKGEANLTLATIAELAAVMGKRARIVFE